jgi:hypothetical protein
LVYKEPEHDAQLQWQSTQLLSLALQNYIMPQFLLHSVPLIKVKPTAQLFKHCVNEGPVHTAHKLALQEAQELGPDATAK